MVTPEHYYPARVELGPDETEADRNENWCPHWITLTNRVMRCNMYPGHDEAPGHRHLLADGVVVVWSERATGRTVDL